MRGTSVKTTITLEIEVEVEGTYYSGSPAITSGSPDNWEPEDPGQVDIESVRSCYPDRSVRDRQGNYYQYPEIPLLVMENIDPNFEDVATDALFAQAEEDLREARAEAQISAYESRMED